MDNFTRSEKSSPRHFNSIVSNHGVTEFYFGSSLELTHQLYQQPHAHRSPKLLCKAGEYSLIPRVHCCQVVNVAKFNVICRSRGNAIHRVPRGTPTHSRDGIESKELVLPTDTFVGHRENAPHQAANCAIEGYRRLPFLITFCQLVPLSGQIAQGPRIFV